MSLEEKFLNFVKENNLIKNGDSIIISFSGGPDSVFLFYQLQRIKEKLGLKLLLFHLNHCLREKESIRDEEFCNNFSKKNNIPIIIKRADVKNFAKKERLSIEEAGRVLRYDLLNAISNEKKFNKIATAHNFDDQIETFFINIFQGRSLRAFEGIKIRQGKIIRPIILFKKREIMEYLHQEGLNYVIDSSNNNNMFLRNKIRNKLIPFLENNFKNFSKKNIFNLTEQIRDLNKFIDSKVNEIFFNIMKKRENGYVLNYDKLPENKFIRYEIYKKIFSLFCNFEYRESIFNELDNFIQNSKGKFNFKDITFYKEQGYIFILKDSIFSQKNKLNKIVINNCGVFFIKDKLKLKIEKINKKEKEVFNKNSRLEFFDFDKVKFPLYIRYFKNGDKFQPLGMKNYQKLKDFFINNKIPKRIRNFIPLLIDKDNEIIWIIGYRISEKVKVDFETKILLKCEILNSCSDL